MNLKDRLKAIHGAEEKKPAAPPTKRSALVVRESMEMMDTSVFNLAPQGLMRMGFIGDFPPAERCLFLDTETTGLSGGAGTLAFLVGIGRMTEDGFCVQQFMLSDYSDEAELLARTMQEIENSDVLVTFNGKTFDLPLLESRYILQRKAQPFPEYQMLDLLYPAKRLYKRRLGSCKLSVLEENLLDIGRTDDLPGREAPNRFFAYLQTGDAAPLEDVLRHNRQDVISMVRLLSCLCAAYADPVGQEHRLDLYSMGRLLEKQGDRQGAKECYRLAGKPVPLTSIEALKSQGVETEAKSALSSLYKKEGEMRQAEEIWLGMIQKKQGGTSPYIALAKYYEHQVKDIGKALRYARAAQSISMNATEQQDIQHRIERLLRKGAM